MPKPMISVAGIRGVVGETLRVEEFFRYVLAFATLMKGGKIVVGGDSRISRNMMRHLAFAALESAGCEIVDLGLVPTPTVGLIIRELGAAGGIAITASHNPAEWNAYKFFGSHGSFLDEEQKNAMLAIAESGDFLRQPYNKLGQISSMESAINIHISRVLSAVDVESIRSKRFKVAVDCVNGVGAVIAKPLLEQLGCKVELIHTNMDEPFPHNPEPLPENLGDLCDKVKAMEADIGFAIDPDADRLAIVDETGRPIGEERTLVLSTWSALRKRRYLGESSPCAVVANLSTSRALDDVATKFGCDLIRTRIGEAWVVKGIMDNDAVIGGEGNGGVIYPAIHPGRDSATGMALILDIMAADGRFLTQMNLEIPDYVMVKTKFPATSQVVNDLAGLISQEFSDAQSLDSTDGVKAIFTDKWIHVRPSGTEPVVRIFAEAPTQELAQQLVDRAQRLF